MSRGNGGVIMTLGLSLTQSVTRLSTATHGGRVTAVQMLSLSLSMACHLLSLTLVSIMSVSLNPCHQLTYLTLLTLNQCLLC